MENMDGNENIQDSEFDVRNKDCVGNRICKWKNVTVSSHGAEALHWGDDVRAEL